MPQAPIIWAPMLVAAARSEAGPVDTSSNHRSSATMPPMAICSSASQLLAALGEALLGVGVLQQPERVAALDDGEHVELPGLADEVGDGRVACLVGGDPGALVGRVDGLVGHAELDQHLGLADVGHGHGGAAVGQRDDERLVHQALQRGRRVPERHAGDDVDCAVLVEVGRVGLLAQVVGDDVGPGTPPGQPEVDGAVEAAGPDERRIEIVLAVGGADDQHVGRHDGGLAELAAVGQVAVDQSIQAEATR